MLLQTKPVCKPAIRKHKMISVILLLILWISKHCWKSFRLSHTTIETKTNFKHAFLASGSNDFPLTYKRSWLEKNVSFFTKYPTSNPQTDTHTHTHTHTHCHRNVHWLCKSKTHFSKWMSEDCVPSTVSTVIYHILMICLQTRKSTTAVILRKWRTPAQLSACWCLRAQTPCFWGFALHAAHRKGPTWLVLQYSVWPYVSRGPYSKPLCLTSFLCVPRDEPSSA